MTLQGLVRPVVDDDGARRAVEQGQVDARDHEDQEAVHGDLAHHEAPVVGEDLVHGVAKPLGRAKSVVELVEGLLGDESPLTGCGTLGNGAHAGPPRSQKPGPTGSTKSLRAKRYPSGLTPSGSWGNGRGAGPNTGLQSSRMSKVDWWHGQTSCMDKTLKSETAQPAWVQIFEKQTRPLPP